ncbi:MAG: protein TolR [Candidatus Competibacteraceae bacterium]|nr:protein TolR [Candidatus Competibacteraceae bacterium]
MAKRRAHKRFMAEINVVPYIDVMLVLLVIFMVTVPLLQQGVEVELPQAAAQSIPSEEQQPLILTVAADGGYYLNLADNPLQSLDPEGVFAETAAVLRLDPQLPVLVKADQSVEYGMVVRAMVLLQQAGADKVGLLTESPETQ